MNILSYFINALVITLGVLSGTVLAATGIIIIGKLMKTIKRNKNGK